MLSSARTSLARGTLKSVMRLIHDYESTISSGDAEIGESPGLPFDSQPSPPAILLKESEMATPLAATTLSKQHNNNTVNHVPSITNHTIMNSSSKEHDKFYLGEESQHIFDMLLSSSELPTIANLIADAINEKASDEPTSDNNFFESVADNLTNTLMGVDFLAMEMGEMRGLTNFTSFFSEHFDAASQKSTSSTSKLSNPPKQHESKPSPTVPHNDGQITASAPQSTKKKSPTVKNRKNENANKKNEMIKSTTNISASSIPRKRRATLITISPSPSYEDHISNQGQKRPKIISKGESSETNDLLKQSSRSPFMVESSKPILTTNTSCTNTALHDSKMMVASITTSVDCGLSKNKEIGILAKKVADPLNSPPAVNRTTHISGNKSSCMDITNAYSQVVAPHTELKSELKVDPDNVSRIS